MIQPSIFQLLKVQSENSPDAPALLAPDRQPMSYGALFQLVEETISRLNSMGIGRGDRVAIVLPNGPEMAAAFLAIASSASSAPLNPAYREAEYEFYLPDLNAKAVVTLDGMVTSVRDVAQRRGIPIVELSKCIEDPAGTFSLEADSCSGAIQTGAASSEDVALVLHTSGTTASPKIVPLTHRNLCSSAANICQSLQLSSADRCLNIMPLFHIHGLMAATLATFAAGGSLVCAPGFYAPYFFSWMDSLKPTWYTAVPTMHQSILARASENKDIINRVQLRFVRSSSSSLPPQIMMDLEHTFNAPVIEAYGMTEASHQMASNPLPPLQRKPASVGIASGPEVAILKEDDHQILPNGAIGEIVIKGDSVMLGYDKNPHANAAAFSGGWFRTGDQGYMDEEGYLYITGRFKEIINRGGEKISPREIDEVLLAHPGVEQALAFAMPDEKLGEDVAAAVVLRDPKVNEGDLRRFAALKLADFKVPRRIVILDDIPKGATGKLQRIGLAQKLGVRGEQLDVGSSPKRNVLPRTTTERSLVELWRHVLKIRAAGIFDRFLDLGGDSILAAQLLSLVQHTFDVEISMLDFFDAPTVSQQADLIEEKIIAQIDSLSDEEIQHLVD